MRLKLEGHVEWVRKMAAKVGVPETLRILAEERGVQVTLSALQRAVYGHTYTQIGGALPSPARRSTRKRSDMLNEEEVNEVRREYFRGERIPEIAERYRISTSYVSMLGRFEARADVQPTQEIQELRKLGRPKRRSSGGSGKNLKRFWIGEANPQSKLREIDVIAIRCIRSIPTGTTIALGKAYGTSVSAVILTAQGKRWPHVKRRELRAAEVRQLPQVVQEMYRRARKALKQQKGV